MMMNCEQRPVTGAKGRLSVSLTTCRSSLLPMPTLMTTTRATTPTLNSVSTTLSGRSTITAYFSPLCRPSRDKDEEDEEDDEDERDEENWEDEEGGEDEGDDGEEEDEEKDEEDEVGVFVKGRGRNEVLETLNAISFPLLLSETLRSSWRLRAPGCPQLTSLCPTTKCTCR